MQSGDGWSAEAVVAAVVIDVVRPRVEWVPEPFDASVGEDAVLWCRGIGMTLDAEQEMVLAALLGARESGRWQTLQVGINEPRQNGKGEILIARQLYGLYVLEEQLVIHTAHEFKTSSRHFKRLEAVVRGCDDLHRLVARRPSGQIVGYRYSHGEEGITLQDGREIAFKTRTKTGMRGFDGVACLTLDEAMIINEDGHNSALPIIRATKAPRGPQILYTGSAVDQESHEHGLVWARIRERGIAGGDQDLCYFEWSLDFAHPDDVPDDVADDSDMWRLTNPALVRGRVSEEHMAWERRALSDRGFKVELLGVGDYPATDGGLGSMIDLETWKALADPGSRMAGSFAFAYDVSPDRSSSAIGAAGLRADGRPHVEIIDHLRGTGWVAARLVELCARHHVTTVLCDAAGPAASLVHDLEDAGLIVEPVSAREHASACGQFFDVVDQGRLRHLGSLELAAAIGGASTRELGEAWAWARKSSRVDISPLVAATLALWGARVEQPQGVPVWAFA